MCCGSRETWGLYRFSHPTRTLRGRTVKLVLVGTRNGKPVVNISFAAIVMFLSNMVGVGIAFLFEAVAPEWPILVNNLGTIGFMFSLAPPLVILGFVLHGLTRPPNQMTKLD